MRFGILGPLEMSDGGGSRLPSAPKERALLALLLAQNGQTVSTVSCIEELWGGFAPVSAKATLQTYVLHLRRSLAGLSEVGSMDGAREILATRDGGYAFTAPGGTLDVRNFERGVCRARHALDRGDYPAAAELFEGALAEWRGPALGDVETGPQLSLHQVRLQESHLIVMEQRNETELHLGRHRALLPELRALVARYPLNENLHAQLMVALARCGEFAAALALYARLRTALGEQLGLEPSARMRRLHYAIVTRDPVLHTTPRVELGLLSIDLAATVPAGPASGGAAPAAAQDERIVS
ncbi:AfsR/SARP family transcriptional regulator [Actinomadura gamaensis]|uniref:BTAD domain-containing putative transcriptional regulator n=1 Tax=Actinomadura gamaensis TaxID=1763541 RepID=A0ABV9TZV9_9ACTN